MKSVVLKRNALALIAMLIFPLAVAGQAAMRSPEGFSVSPLRANAGGETDNSAAGWAARYWIGFFSRHISPADGPRSPSYPTGSAYGLQAIRLHGPFIGIILTADRLLHEIEAPGDGRIILYGQKRVFDPVIANTYWWSQPSSRPKPEAP